MSTIALGDCRIVILGSVSVVVGGEEEEEEEGGSRWYSQVGGVSVPSTKARLADRQPRVAVPCARYCVREVRAGLAGAGHGSRALICHV